MLAVEIRTAFKFVEVTKFGNTDIACVENSVVWTVVACLSCSSHDAD